MVVVGLALLDPDLPLPLTEPLLEPFGREEPVVDGAVVLPMEPVDFAPVVGVGAGVPVAVGLTAAVVVSAFR